MISYAGLLILALALNISSRRMLALSAIVGAGIFVTVPDKWFYLNCIAIELVVALFAFCLSCSATFMITRISAILVIMHILGWMLDGHPDESPYHGVVRLLEHAELVVCILFSRPILDRWLNV